MEKLENRGLWLSITGCLFMAALAFVFAHLSGSAAIFLDGVFSLVNFLMSLVMLRVSRLIQRKADPRFPFGYASFEPAFNVLQSLVSLGVMLMALSSAVFSLFRGGRELDTGIATIYAAVASLGCLVIYLYLRRIGKVTESSLIQVDAFTWMIDTVLSAVVLCAFASAWHFGEKLGGFLPYLDAWLVIGMVVLMLPVPFRILYQNLMEVLLAAPSAEHQLLIHQAFTKAMRDIPAQDWSLSISKAGRSTYLHARILLKEGEDQCPIALADEWRENLTERMRDYVQEREFDVVFTTDASYL
ncbi:Ferrous-iron efflux pump FieF [Microbulbifer aggregans]|uniref:Ferrous-iron efflux pump FieF n=1 Tax=Microbulbifer aggregans TaxID=1769779 RepID=A0A1C9W5F1_9GAMM|nr:cation diffusion facilitator family transporter [Microbulbifer aggregans]AOS96350.1 Ferrous-iron efflux pump FieF [Microbulbifer aggregans]